MIKQVHLQSKELENDNKQCQSPLWQLCRQSLSIQQNEKQIRVFLESVKPARFLHIQKHVLLSRLFNLLFTVKLIILDRLVGQQQEWGFTEFVFVALMMIQILFLAKKRTQLQQCNGNNPKYSLQRSKHQNNPIKNIVQKCYQKCSPLIEYLILAISYLIYTLIQPYFIKYYPQWIGYFIFIYLLITGNNQSDADSMKKSSVLIFFTQLNSYWMGLFSLVVNNRYQFIFQQNQQSFHQDQQRSLSTVQIFLTIDVISLLLLTEWLTIKWTIFIIFICLMIHIVCIIDKQCISLKKKYKDQGEVINYEEYH